MGGGFRPSPLFTFLLLLLMKKLSLKIGKRTIKQW